MAEREREKRRKRKGVGGKGNRETVSGEVEAGVPQRRSHPSSISVRPALDLKDAGRIGVAIISIFSGLDYAIELS